MTDYDKIIINKLLDIYERRGAYKKDDSQIRSITLSVADTFHGYTDNSARAKTCKVKQNML